ncbi:unnamed protein product (macronuclear) [Paramecium tetraurelia]|uniref:phosphatidylinositol-3,4,5-trisphosphate 3-phosphatase n=1 Tax=Paramecium tetraurelia TaxID=5888 RepID=A0DZT4_PARTE|nr:uncharacterized protein GSPATT00021719001 [Paramecium tetraurelia]CAK88551.1 unnamed protein product [Paramecium tetraurelia]|eukprot:XP_001455948.1 hypothetical protein (macronuclear) [Paramecium tetraurelia strain d4-2]
MEKKQNSHFLQKQKQYQKNTIFNIYNLNDQQIQMINQRKNYNLVEFVLYNEDFHNLIQYVKNLKTVAAFQDYKYFCDWYEIEKENTEIVCSRNECDSSNVNLDLHTIQQIYTLIIVQQILLMIQMQDIQESMILNYISSDEEDESESLLMNQSPVEIKQKQQLSDIDQSISQIPSELSFNRNMDRRINETIVLQNQADEITLKSTKNAKEAYQREIIKELVSKQKKRFKVDGFNLDLTYITDNVIAMGFPAESFEAIYRNPMPEVQKFLNSRHPNNYMVINLCSERKYKHESFYKVAEFPFDDHQAPPFNMMLEFCQKVHEWLKANSNHVVAIHCKAGKGRTGVMVCCYLLFSGKYTSSQDALAYYGLVRTQNKKGVTIPSQIRYVHYFSYALKNDLVKMPYRQIELVSVRLVGVSHGTLIRVQNNRQVIDREGLDRFRKGNTICFQ